MRVYGTPARRDYEELFRSIGGRLDDARMRDFLVVELDDGFYVRGTSAAADWDSLTRMHTLRFPDSEIGSVMEAAHARRGTDKWAGRVEAALRLIGRYVDAHGGSEVMVVERGDFTLLRMAVPGSGFQFLELGPENLSNWATTAWQSRRPEDE